MDIGLFLLPVGELEYLEIEKTIIRKCYDSEKSTTELYKKRRNYTKCVERKSLNGIRKVNNV